MDLSCSANDNGCDVGPVTYLWEEPSQICSFIYIKRVTGFLENQNFISKKEELILKIGNEVQPKGCSQIVCSETNLNNIFIVQTEKYEHLNLKISQTQSVDINIQEFVNEKDDFLKYELLQNAK